MRIFQSQTAKTKISRIQVVLSRATTGRSKPPKIGAVGANDRKALKICGMKCSRMRWNLPKSGSKDPAQTRLCFFDERNFWNLWIACFVGTTHIIIVLKDDRFVQVILETNGWFNQCHYHLNDLLLQNISELLKYKSFRLDFIRAGPPFRGSVCQDRLSTFRPLRFRSFQRRSAPPSSAMPAAPGILAELAKYGAADEARSAREMKLGRSRLSPKLRISFWRGISSKD